MTTIELLSHLRSLGVKVWVDGDRLRYSAPKGALTPDLLAQLAAQKVSGVAHWVVAAKFPAPPADARRVSELYDGADGKRRALLATGTSVYPFPGSAE